MGVHCAMRRALALSRLRTPSCSARPVLLPPALGWRQSRRDDGEDWQTARAVLVLVRVSVLVLVSVLVFVCGPEDS